MNAYMILGVVVCQRVIFVDCLVSGVPDQAVRSGTGYSLIYVI